MPSKKEESTNRAGRSREISPSPSTKGKSWFFGIGINQYNAGFKNLNNARKDVDDILKELGDRYELEKVITLFDKRATKNEILDQFQYLDERLQSNDKLIIYFAGHGYLDKKERGYWIPSDATIGRASSYINNIIIRDYIAHIAAKHILLISDSCFSGSLIVRGSYDSGVVFDDLERDPSRWVFSSGRDKELVADGKVGENSPFAAGILKVLRQNGDAQLNTSLLCDQATKLTRYNYEQLPQSGPLFGAGHQGGQYVFRLRLDEESAWQRATKDNSTRSYGAYLEQFPTGKYAKSALTNIEQLEDEEEWQKAQAIDKIYQYRIYIHSFPKPLHAKEAQKRITELEKPIFLKKENENISPQKKITFPSSQSSLKKVLIDKSDLSKYLVVTVGFIVIVMMVFRLPPFFEKQASDSLTKQDSISVFEPKPLSPRKNLEEDPKTNDQDNDRPQDKKLNIAPAEYGQAVVFDNAFQGRETAYGIKYDTSKLTTAHKRHPEGSLVRVTRLDNGKYVDVRVIDQGPFIKGAIVDLSLKAAQILEMKITDKVNVKVEKISNIETDE